MPAEHRRRRPHVHRANRPLAEDEPAPDAPALVQPDPVGVVHVAERAEPRPAARPAALGIGEVVAQELPRGARLDRRLLLGKRRRELGAVQPVGLHVVEAHLRLVGRARDVEPDVAEGGRPVRVGGSEDDPPVDREHETARLTLRVRGNPRGSAPAPPARAARRSARVGLGEGHEAPDLPPRPGDQRGAVRAHEEQVAVAVDAGRATHSVDGELAAGQDRRAGLEGRFRLDPNGRGLGDRPVRGDRPLGALDEHAVAPLDAAEDGRGAARLRPLALPGEVVTKRELGRLAAERPAAGQARERDGAREQGRGAPHPSSRARSSPAPDGS